MINFGYVYCAALGACNFLILRAILTFGIRQALVENMRNPDIRRGVMAGLAITLIGGIAYRTAGFNPPNVTDPSAWLLAFGVPLILAFVTRRPVDPGWSGLQRGKALWQSLPLQMPVGMIDQEAARFRGHPRVLSAEALIRGAIDHAPRSNVDPIRATANAGIAWQELGLLRRAINDFTEARRYFDRSLHVLDSVPEYEANNPRVLYAKRETLFRLAELDHALGNREEARRGYLASLEIDGLLGHDDPVGENTTQELLSRLEPDHS